MKETLLMKLKFAVNNILSPLLLLALALPAMEFVILLLFATCAPPVCAQDVTPVDAPLPGLTVVERGLNHRVIQTPNGGQYTELGTGLHFMRNGELLPSDENIVIDNEGYGVAEHGQHTARFSPSITDSPAVVYTDPDGNVFSIRPLCMALLDYSSGKSVLLCETRTSIGTVDSNSVTYAQCFSDGIRASIRYAYRRGSFESDVILLAQLPPVSDFGLNEATVRLQIWHELINPPQPRVRTTSFIYREPDEALRQAYSEPDFKDDFLEFGSRLQFVRGHAFLMDSDAIRQVGINVAEEVQVGKEWMQAVDPDTGAIRSFIVESVELGAIAPLLATLPTAAIPKPDDPTSRLAKLRQSKGLTRQQLLAALPKAPLKARSTAKLQMASVSSPGVPPVQPGVSPANRKQEEGPGKDKLGAEMKASRRDAYSTTDRTSRRDAYSTKTANSPKGLVVDFVTVLTQTNMTFASDKTYWVGSSVSLAGTNILEAAVIKFAKSGSQISISGSGATLLCKTGLGARPAILTAEDDASVGEAVGENSSPSGYYGNYYLYFDAGSSGVLSSLSNARFLYATAALGYAATASGSGHQATHCQFYNCQSIVKANYSSDVLLRNVLAASPTYVVNGYGITARGENMTISSATWLTNGGNATLWLTNGLLCNITHAGYSGGESNQTASSNPFTTVSGGAYYLKTNSIYRGLGSTNINAALAADLRQLTTWPPTLITNTISADTNLAIQAQRGGSVPDLGFSYYPLDWILSGVALTNATLTLTNSVAVGISGTVGLKMRTGSKLASTGTAIGPVRLVRLESVQEQGGSSGTKTALFADDLVSGASLPEARLRFTELSLLPSGGAQFSGGGKMGVLAAQDCRFLGGGLTWNVNGTNTRALTLTNNLFERTTNMFGTGSDPLAIHARNNLFKSGSINFKPVGTNTWTWFDDAFDTTTLTQNTNTLTNDFNGYLYTSGLNRLTNGSSTNDIVITNGFSWQSSWLGNYYQPGNSGLVQKGSRSAAAAGLFELCVLTNQVAEGTNRVTIGLHYVACDANGLGIDQDADGLIDVVEDVDGDGLSDGNENSFINPVIQLTTTNTCAPASWFTNSPASIIDAWAIVKNDDSPYLANGWLRVDFSAGGESGDALGIANQGTNSGQIGVSGSNISYGNTNVATFSGGSGTNALVVTFTNTMTVDAAQALVRRLTCQSTNGVFTNWSRTIRFAINDGRTGTNNPLAYLTVNLLAADAGPDRSSVSSFSCATTGQVLIALGTMPARPSHPVGITYYEPTNAIMLSFNFHFGLPYNFEIFATNGAGSPLLDSIAFGLNDEILLTSVRDEGGGTNRGGFQAGDIFFGTGTAGQIGRISTNLTSFERNWLTVSNETGYLEGGLYIDRSGVFGGDLIICTTVGNVWRVSSSKSATRLAAVTNVALESVITVPNDTSRYGPWASHILMGVHDTGPVYTVSTNGSVTNYSLGFAAEDLKIIPPNENFFAVEYDASEDFPGHQNQSKLWGASWCSFAGTVGDLVMIEEGYYNNSGDQAPGRFYHVWWDGTNFQHTQIFTNANVTQLEHFTFGPAGVAEIPPVNTITVTGLLYSPPACPLMPTWSKVGGTGTVGFGSPNSNITTVAFGQSGTYTLQLAASGCSCSVTDTVVVTVTNGLQAPNIFISSPSNGQVFTFSPTNTPISGTANDAYGNITNVQFFQSGARLDYPIATNGPSYTMDRRPTLGGTYTFTAAALDDHGLGATSAPVTITVNYAPTVVITNPLNGAVFIKLTNNPTTDILIEASAADTDGTLSKVEFFHGTNLIGADTTSPYRFTWTNAPAGTYTLYARATDNLGATANSEGVFITVYETNGPPKVNPGPNLTNRLGTTVFLTGTVSDDGLPHGSNLTVLWTNISGPAGGVVSFVNSNAAATTATFSKTGVYVLQLSASDSQFMVSSNMTNTVWPTNQAPVVNAGPDRAIVWPALAGTTNLIGGMAPLWSLPQIPLGIDYFAPSNTLISLSPTDTNLILLSPSDGIIRPYSSLTGGSPGDEHQVAAVRNSFGGFSVGEVFFGSSDGFGGIYRIGLGGKVIGTNGGYGNVWAIVPSTDEVVSGIAVDGTGSFAGDLLVLQLDGVLWRVNSNGQTNRLASLGAFSEPNLLVVPNDPGRYGPWAGRILAGDPNGRIFAVDTNGFAVVYPGFGPASMRIIPANQNLFAVRDKDANLWSAPASAFEGKAGDILIAEDSGDLYAVRWNGQEFRRSLVLGGFSAIDWQEVAFAPVGGTNLFPLTSSVQLAGTATDDGVAATLTTNWVQVSGPAPVSFDNASLTNTFARFSQEGTYVLRLTANDGELESYKEVTISIVRNQGPTVNAGTNQIIASTNATLVATVSDDGWPSNQLSLSWSLVSPPAGGAANFATNTLITNSTNVVWTNAVSFTPGITGSYLLQFTARDGQATNRAQVRITVGAPELTLVRTFGGIFPTNGIQVFTATLRDVSGAPISGTNVQFTVTGVNPRTNTLATDANGNARFSYTGASAGRDFLQASGTVNGQTVSSYSAPADWALNLICGQTNQGTFSATDSPDSLGIASGMRYADYFYFSGQANEPISLTYTPASADGMVLVLMGSSNEVLHVVSGTNGMMLLENLPYSGAYFVELTTLETSIIRTNSYFLSLACGSNNVSLPEMAVPVNGTNLVNGGTMVFGPTLINVPVTNMMVITNSGSTSLLLGDLQWTSNFQASLSASNVPPGSSTTLQIIFNASSNGVTYGALSMSNNAAARSFVLSLIGEVFPAGTNPAIQLTSPANDADYFAPANISISASVTTTSTVAYVSFQAISTNGVIPIGVVYSNTMPTITWPNVPVGDFTIAATAFDTLGRSTVSSPVTIHVLDPKGNHKPRATNDDFTVLANSAYNLLPVLRNDGDPDGDPIQIIWVGNVHPPAVAQIINNGQAINYVPPAFSRGNDYFSYTISDGRGGTATAWVNVNIFGTLPPMPAITSPTNNATLTPGTVVTLQVSMAPWDFVGTVEFSRAGFKLATVTNAPYQTNWTVTYDPSLDQPGVCDDITAVATDRFGQQGSTNICIRVSSLTNAPPIAAISNLSNADIILPSGHKYPNLPIVRDGLFVLLGSAYQSNSTDVAYAIHVLSTAGNFIKDVTPLPVMADGFHSGSVTNGTLGTNDFTMLRNGVYLLELVVRGGNQQTNTTVQFQLESDLKIGQFSFSEQDMVIPVSGIPLTIIRTYNSLNTALTPNPSPSMAGRGNDFGAGWTFAVNDVEMEIDEQRELVESLFDEGNESEPFGNFINLRVGGGRDVTLTLPDGRRTTFAYSLVEGNCNPGDEIALCATPTWTAAPGVNAKLTPLVDNKLAFLPFGGPEWWTDNGSGAPDNYDFSGFTLTTADGTQYRIDREDFGEQWFISGETTESTNFAHIYGQGHVTQIKPHGSSDTIYIQSPQSMAGVPSTFKIVQTNAAGVLTRSIVCQRDADGHIVAISDPNGLDSSGNTNGPPALTYKYAGGNLIAVNRLTDRVVTNYLTTSYDYTNVNYPHYITGIRDARGKTVARTLFDSDGRLIGMIDANGKTNLFSHDLTGRREVHTDRAGQPTIYVYDTQGNVTNIINALGATNQFRYDTNGYLLAQIDALGNTTTYTNDARGNVAAVTLPYPPGADPAAYTTYFTYDDLDNQTSVTLPTGGVVSNVFSASGVLLNSYADGNLISFATTNAAGLIATDGDLFGTNSYGYDSIGNATNLTDALGLKVGSLYDPNGDLTNLVDRTGTSSVQYDAQGRETSAAYPQGITVAYAQGANPDWDSVDGPTVGHIERNFDDQSRLSGWKTANGSTPGFAYDDAGRLLYETNSIGQVTQHTYDAVGNAIAVTNLATGAGMVYGYDAAQRRIAETNAVGGFSLYGYNPDGSVSAITNAFLTNYWLMTYQTGGGCCGGGATTTTTDPLGRQAIDARSAHGLPLQSIFLSGTNASTNTTVYMAGLISSDQEAEEYPIAVTDEGGRTRNLGYTGFGQQLWATDLGGTNAGGIWTNLFDPTTGALNGVVSPTGETNSFVYDLLDNVVTNRYSDGQQRVNFYNAANRLASNTLPSGALVQYAYDSAGRLTNRNSSLGEIASLTYNGNDAITGMTDNTGTTVNHYGADGLLSGIDFPTGASVAYRRDLLGRITNVTAKASQFGMPYSTSYFYDLVGNLAKIVDPFNGITTFQYDRLNRRTKRTLPNGIVSTYDWDWRDRLTNIVHKASNGTVLASAAYLRNQGGEPSRITREDGSYADLKYDSAWRLTNEIFYASGTPQGTNGYGYDKAGNRVRLYKGGLSLTNSVSAGFRVTAIRDASNGSTNEAHTFDNGGREIAITRDGTTLSLGYNTADQATAATNSAASTWVTYVQDGTGRRVLSTNSVGEVRRFLVAPTPGTDLESPLLIGDAYNSVAAGFVYLGDAPILHFDGAGNVTYYLEDAMGTVLGEAPYASPGTNNTSRFFYDGFGNARSTNGPAPSVPGGVDGDFRFQSAWLETGSGLYNMRAREYDPRTGRFTGRDPAGGTFRAAESFAPYVFANSDPEVYDDPSGTFTLIEINVTGAINTGLQTIRAAAIAKGRQKVFNTLANIVKNQVIKSVRRLLPIDDFLSSWTAGTKFERRLRKVICDNLDVPDGLFFEVPVTTEGRPLGDGFTCDQEASRRQIAPLISLKVPRPDFIVGPRPPNDDGRYPKTWLIAEAKSTTAGLFRDYISPGTSHGRAQFFAIINYAAKHTYSRTAIFITGVKGARAPPDALVIEEIGRSSLRSGVLPIVVRIVD